MDVAGDSNVQADRSSWRRLAVLEIQPRDVSFQIGWRRETYAAAEFYIEPARNEDGKLLMEVGDQGVWFVARPLDGRTQLVIELIELVDKDDFKYSNVPQY